MNVVKTTVVLDPELHRAIRHLAVDLNMSFQELAVQALREFLERQKVRTRSKGGKEK